MPVIPPNVRHVLYFAILLAGGARLLQVDPKLGWAIFAAQVLALMGAIFTDSPGTAERLAAAKRSGVIAGAAANDRQAPPL